MTRRTASNAAAASLLAAFSFMLVAPSVAQKATMPPRTLDTPHLFSPPASRVQWEARAAALRRQILFSAGLWPMPEKTPLRPRVTGRLEGPDFIVENVAIEAYPGFFLCGNLYQPKNRKGPFPAIVNPHGHWENGRLERQEDVPRAAPPPAPPGEGRGNLVAIGVNLARQGFVVFAYDMVGYNDTSPQLPHRGFAAGLEPWLSNVSVLGLQLWNSLRAVDYVESLPDVDKKRIGATGASGGGTQVFLLAAVDERIKVSVPVNMVSAHMQVGCLCENAPGLRVGTDNVEIAALAAPRPQLLVAATGDWTKDNPRIEWPALKRVYDLYGAGERTAVRQFNYQHNYNVESREAMYEWFGRWLQKRPEGEGDYAEKPFDLDVAALRVWNAQNPPPKDARDAAALIAALRADHEKQLAALWPKDRDPASAKRFRDALLPALRHSLAVQVPDKVKAEASSSGGAKRAALLVSVAGAGAADAPVRDALAARGFHVEALTLPPIDVAPPALRDNFFTTYNRTPLGDRVQEIVDALGALKRQGYARVELVGVGPAGLWALLARGVSADAVPGSTVADVDGFDGNEDRAFVERLYAPGLRRAGDVRSAALLALPNALCLHNAGTTFRPKVIAAGYRARKVPLRVEPSPLSAEAIADWLSGR